MIVKKPWDTFKDIAGMEVTPYLVDHSAADAFAYLIDADKKRIFYAGDFRGHGKKKILFENMLKHPPKNIDLLMLEGTTIEAARVEEQASEQDVEEKLVSLFGENNKLVIFACSHQNIDRLTVLYNACLRTDKTLAMIPYTAYILHKLKILSDKIPQHSMKNIRVFFEGTPNTKRVLADEELCEKLRRVYIGYDEIVAHKERMVVLDSTFVRKQFGRRGYLKDAMLIYSLWDGYLEDVKPFWDDHGVHIKKLHSSGHASVDELKQFVSALKPARIIPIHTKHPEKFHEHFGDIVMKVSDGERVNL